MGIVFKEFDVPNPLRCNLRDDDTPYAHIQEEAGFTNGGELTMKRVVLPGRREPLYHVMRADDRPLVFRGAFRDYRMGAGHALAQRNLIERMRDRANLLRLAYDGRQWTVLLKETSFGEEGPGHITYELTFDVGLPPDVGGATAPARNAGGSAALDRVLAQLRARPVPPPQARGILAAFNRIMRAVEGAMEQLTDAQRQLENVRDNAVRQVRRVTSLGAQVQERTQDMRRMMTDSENTARALFTSVKDTVTWDTFKAGLFTDMRRVDQVARDATEDARRRQYAPARLYRVKPGDTLESIAREQLCDASRSADLGVSAAQLYTGMILRIPTAAG